MMQEPSDLSGRPQQAGTAIGKGLIEIDPDVARLGGMEAKQQPAAPNAPIQGSSADIIKLATVQLQNGLQRQGLPAQLLLQAHDELCWRCHQTLLRPPSR